MSFTKGKSGNPQGRKPGSKDKAQTDIKEAFQTLVENNLSNVETWLNEVAAENPAKALDFMLRLSEFIVPKQKAVEFKEPAPPEKKLVFKWGDREIEI